MNNKLEKMIQTGTTLILIILIFFMIHNVNDIQGTARIVNYAGLVRGETQRLVKLEITGIKSQEMIDELDDYVEGIKNGSKELNLVLIDDECYQNDVAKLEKHWQKVKNEIEFVRQNGYVSTKIVEISEDYFNLSDEVVACAENYSQKCATNIRYLEVAIIFCIVIILASMIKQSIDAIKVIKMNRLLKEKVFWDEQTELPNKNKCLLELDDSSYNDKVTTVFMFDLNNLKYVNDHMGHEAGDSLIYNFAKLIRTNIPKSNFVGRYGGDEFIAIVIGDKGKEIIESVYNAIEKYNKEGEGIPISYAAGYATSNENNLGNLKSHLAIADKKMYENKRITKKSAEDMEKAMDQRFVEVLEYSASHDGLTSLWNKTTAFQMIEKTLKKNEAKSYTMFVIDIDNFKQVNDNLGHGIGDEVLKNTADIITLHFRKNDIVARFGGDEFFVFTMNLLSKELLKIKAQAILNDFDKYYDMKYEGVKITLSIGIVEVNEYMDVQSFFHKADEALYLAKRRGKNQFVIK